MFKIITLLLSSLLGGDSHNNMFNEQNRLFNEQVQRDIQSHQQTHQALSEEAIRTHEQIMFDNQLLLNQQSMFNNGMF